MPVQVGVAGQEIVKEPRGDVPEPSTTGTPRMQSKNALGAAGMGFLHRESVPPLLRHPCFFAQLSQISLGAAPRAGLAAARAHENGGRTRLQRQPGLSGPTHRGGQSGAA